MARFSTVRPQCQFDTSGERRFAERLGSCWKTITSGGATSGQAQGALFLLRRAASASHYRRLKTVANPMQAHTYKRSAAGQRKNKSAPFFINRRRIFISKGI